MAKRNRKDTSSETEVIVSVSSELTDKQIRKQAKKEAKALEFHQSWFARFMKRGVWPVLVPFVVVMLFLVLLPLLAIIIYAILKPTGDTNYPFAVTGENFVKLFTSGGVWVAIGLSIGYALVASILCVVIGYPIAFIMSQLKSKILAKNVWVLVTMPMWISMLLKVLGLRTFFTLMSGTFVGLPICIIVGMIYMFIPFAIGPMYDSITSRDMSQEEAARDLGCGSARTFFTITIRNTIAGMLTGFSLVIVQAATSLIVVHYLGAGKVNLIASIIESYFFMGSNFAYGSAIAVVLTVLVFVIMLIIALLTKRFETNRKSKKGKWKNSEKVVISHL